jgi:hypothetical protein
MYPCGGLGSRSSAGGRSKLEVACPHSAPADRRSRALTGRSASPSTVATAAGRAPQSVEWAPLQKVRVRGGEGNEKRRVEGTQRFELMARSEEQKMRSVEVRGFPFLLRGFIDPREQRSPNRACAPCVLTAGDCVRHRRAGPTTPKRHTRDHCGVATEDPQRAVTSACPRRPLRARLRRLKRRAHSARPRPRS